jgi:hypothetical protein
LKRPFEANEGDGAGHTGHYKNEPASGRTKFESVEQHHKHENNRKPLALHLSSRAAVEIVKHLGLEPERDGVIRVLWLWQNKMLCTQRPCDKSRHCHAHSRA